jgi:wyosine [tRNA(Phe)-imidazoG37] synthetase (radical SAM superfamily)
MSFAYGPVPSRRFGRSIGVSPIPPKACTYSCVYCQLGKTTDLRIERDRFFDPKAIERDMENAMESCEGNADFITMVGDGEPTLSSDVGRLISYCHKHWAVPVGVITNGSLLWDRKVRTQIHDADIVSVTVSAGGESTFRKVHRPHKSLNFKKAMDGIREFRKDYPGKLWAEVMLVAGLNDSRDSLHSIKAELDSISPDRIFIAAPTRPPTEPWVRPPGTDRILDAADILGGSVEMTLPEAGSFEVAVDREHMPEAILQLCSRHPMMEHQLREIEGRMDMRFVDDMVDANIAEWKPHMGIMYLVPVKTRKGRKERCIQK